VTMNPLVPGLPLGLAALLLTASTAGATVQSVVAPGPGVSAITVSDAVTPGKVTVDVTTPVSDGHFSVLFLDIDSDGDSDRVVQVSRGTTASIVVRATPSSTTSCQQIGGTSASTVTTGVESAFKPADAGYTVSIPAAMLSGAVGWKITADAPDETCGGTDDSVLGLPVSLADARTFAAPTVAPDTTAPAAPTGLVAVADLGGTWLDWDDAPETDVANYLVYRQIGSGAFTLRTETAASRLTETGLTPGVPYTYYVKAVDKAGNVSAESAKVTATPHAIPKIEMPPSPEIPSLKLPAGSKKLLDVGGLAVVSSKKPTELPRYVAKTGKTVVAVLVNSDPVPSLVTSTIKMRWYWPEKVRDYAIASQMRTVTVGTSRVTIAPGQSAPLSFTLNDVGRRIAAKGRPMKLRAAVTVRPEGLQTRKGQLAVTVKPKRPAKSKARR
jgi:hypothetical protein